MKTIVEGIEKTEQLNMIRKLGIDEAQGYLLGRASQDPEAVLRQGRTATEPQYESEVSAAEVFA